MYEELLIKAIIVYQRLLLFTWNNITVQTNIITWNHITVHKLLVLDRNTWNNTTMCKLFLLDRNTWYHINMAKTLKKQL